MSNADLLVEAVDTAITLGWSLLGWIIFLAAAGSILVLAAIATGAYGVRAVWRRTAGPSWRRGHIRAAFLAHARLRRSKRHTRPREFEEAA